jgi:hypothetical protein
MNKCTLCTGRAGADGVVDPHTALPTRAIKNASGQFISTLPLPSGGALPVPIVPELAHEPACVSTCPAKAMKWDAKDNILAYLQDPANGYTLPDGTMNWNGSGAIYWAAKKTVNKLVPAKADPYVEDHVAPMVSGALTNPLLIAGAVALGGFAMLAERKDKIAAEELGSKSEEV